MKAARYQQLLGRLLEDDLSDTQAEELACALKSSHELRQDLRRHLVMWELWSQDQALERSATRFVHSWETRLGVDGEGANEFTDAVKAKLENFGERDASETLQKEAQTRETTGRRMALWYHGLRIFSQQRAILFWALSAIMALVGYAWVATTRSTHAATIIRGEGICTFCTLHQGHEHLQAIRVVGPADEGHLYYLEANRFSAGIYFCDGPIPVVGKGYLKTNETRVSLVATEINVPRR